MSSVAIAEIMLSLYPIAVKMIQTNLFTQVFFRALSYVAISIFFVSLPTTEIILNPSYIIISILNLVHIFSSYVGFINLDAGVAMTLFYIYPFFNIIFKSIIDKTGIHFDTIKYMILSLIGVALISIPKSSTNSGSRSVIIGLISILIAALTESLIYTFYKTKPSSNPFNGIFTLYAFSIILMLLFAPKFLQITNNGENIMKLIIFNVMIGLVGHIFRFYGIPRLSTEVYSINLFIGVISAYIFGWYFVGEKITIYHIIGSILIMFSIYQINK
jgi:drug/metabolite transporter (DMT)-like permease